MQHIALTVNYLASRFSSVVISFVWGQGAAAFLGFLPDNRLYPPAKSGIIKDYWPSKRTNYDTERFLWNVKPCKKRGFYDFSFTKWTWRFTLQSL